MNIHWFRSRVLPAAVFVLLVGCAPPSESSGAPADAQPSVPKRITAAISSDPASVYNKLNASGAAGRGVAHLEHLVSAGLSVEDDRGLLTPRLAEAVPSVDNGLWQLYPDGSMETTWRLREGARWHDGTPLSIQDLLFTLQVARDPELPAFGDAAYAALDAVVAADDRTVRARWRRPYIEADRMFSAALGLPLPRHLLEADYLESKGSFAELPYWTQRFVGNGPYRLRDWVIGSHLLLEAFDGYALGRPRIDEIEIRFILDYNVLVANVLAGQIDVAMTRGFSMEQTSLVREQWRAGRVEMGPVSSAISAWPQLLDPTPAAVADVRFRRALFRALDRPAMVDSLEGGLVSVTHSFLMPTLPEYRELERYIVRYDYDPRGAVQEIEALGYARGPDGSFQSGGQRLVIEARTTAGLEINERTLLAVADYWQQVGIAVETVFIPPQRAGDQQYRATFPGFEVLRAGSDVREISNYRSTAARLPENNYRGTGGTNRSRYMNPEFDALIDRFYATIPRRERMEIAGQIVHHMTDQVLVMGLFYDPLPGFVSNRLLNVSPLGGEATLPWNIHEWDIASKI
jgi:peptide/nickel transport system substrate-binding protein